MGALDELSRYFQPAASLASSAIAEPIAGWAGILSGLDADTVHKVRSALTYQPKSPQGQQGMDALAQFMASAKQKMVDENPPVNAAVNAYKNASDYVGDRSPLAGALMASAPAAAMALLGPGSAPMRSAFGSAGRGVANGLDTALANAGAAPVMRGPLSAQQGAITWHGSPHQFDAFDSSKIGSGDGKQTYGHGLYLADNPEVSKLYMNTGAPGGNLYKVDLPDEHIANMLNFDMPISEHPPQTQAAIKSILDSLSENTRAAIWPDSTGAELYHDLSGLH